MLGAEPARALRGLARLSLLCVAAACAGCATHAELRKVRQDQREMRAMMADNQVALDGLRRRVEVLRTELDDAKRRPAAGGMWSPTQLQRRLREVEQRVTAIEMGRPLPPAEPGAPLPGPEGTAPPVGAASVDPMAREEEMLQTARVDDTYRDAFRLLRGGEYGKAVPGFREFLRRNERSDYADDAQFWIGECYYALGDYNRAILEFNEVLLKYPGSDRVPRSLLRQAFAFSELGDNVDARLILQKLVNEYPKSPEAEQAQKKLQTLGE